MTHELIGKKFDVLKHGSITLIEVMGEDAEVERAARISYGEGTRSTSDTTKLLRHLMRHYHTTPFEMLEMKFRIKMPMDVNRQFIRHRTASVNEYSTRYSLPIEETDTTDVWRLQSNSNKQGSSGELEDWPDDSEWDTAKSLYDTPSEMLSDFEAGLIEANTDFYKMAVKLGVAREQARKVLSLSTYTELIWKCDLHNIMHFLRLRCDSHAQQEIREYANVIAHIVYQVFPISFEAWYDYRFLSANFSRYEMEIIQKMANMLSEEDLRSLVEDSPLSAEDKKREKREFFEKLKEDYSISVDRSRFV